MHLALRTGISFCCVDGRLLFLDVIADRYFCLSARAEECFLGLVGTGGRVADRKDALDALISRGMLVEAPTPVPLRPCTLPPLPEESVLDQPLPRGSLRQAVGALGRLTAVQLRLKIAGLARTLTSISVMKARLEPVRGNPDMLLCRTMAGFGRATGVATILDNCLGQSIAIAHDMLARGLGPDVVLGVRLGPFNAHCWVQYENRLVNDRFDMVRTFTPILVI
ncbi:lasso peptide biosynthesis B2 protein [Flavisphingomonas formosensis]|uniref:lasso peptide biosynthesis B2 protein n=1 Tax=Flavisphingomonas formosensis TaxID=861534 RepID=UPI0012FC6847|nr:lasso peptide biosynthesis B2 protein [Sphingomonas formosensis]